MVGDASLAGSNVDGTQRTRHRRYWFHRRTDPEHLTGAHATLCSARPVRCPGNALLGWHDFVMGRAASAASQLESVAHLDALDGLDPHQRTSELRVQAAIPVHVRTQ